MPQKIDFPNRFLFAKYKSVNDMWIAEVRNIIVEISCWKLIPLNHIST